MTQNNILLISGAILPVIITVIIGYISGKRGNDTNVLISYFH